MGAHATRANYLAWKDQLKHPLMPLHRMTSARQRAYSGAGRLWGGSDGHIQENDDGDVNSNVRGSTVRGGMARLALDHWAIPSHHLVAMKLKHNVPN